MARDWRDERIAELEAKLAARDEQLAAARARIAELEQQVNLLTAKVAELLERLGQSSRNSHRSPSSDPPAARQERKGKKGKGQRKRGGQPGHRGAHRALVPPDRINDFVHLEPHHRGLYALLTKKAEQAFTIPGSLRRHVAPETMRGWLRAYRCGGFDALVPRVRADHGSARSLPPSVVDLLCQLKEDSPDLSIPSLLEVARAQHPSLVTDEVKLPESTVHRVLARRGLMKRQRPAAPSATTTELPSAPRKPAPPKSGQKTARIELADGGSRAAAAAGWFSAEAPSAWKTAAVARARASAAPSPVR